MASAAVALAVVGCSGTDDSTNHPSRTSTDVARPPASTSSRASRVIDAGHDRPPRWVVVAQWTLQDPDQGLGVADDRHVATHTLAESRGHFRLSTRDGIAVVSAQASKGELVQGEWLDHRHYVVEHLDPDAKTLGISAYSLRGDRATEIDMSGVNAAVNSPSLAYDKGTLAWARGEPFKDRMCIGVTQLASGRYTELDCAPRDVIVDDIALANGTVVYSELSDGGHPARRCKRIMVVDLHGQHDRGAEIAMAKQSDCAAWSGVPLRDGIAWNVADPASSDFAFGHAFYWGEDHLTDLGIIDTDSLVSCGNLLFWTAGHHEAKTPYWWRPGAPRSQIALALSERTDESTTLPYCASGRFLTTRAEEATGRPSDRLRLKTLDTAVLSTR